MLSISCSTNDERQASSPYQWVNLDIDGEAMIKPSARSGHVTSPLGEHRLLLYGGLTYNEEKSEEQGKDIYTYAGETWEYDAQDGLWADYTIRPTGKDEAVFFGKAKQKAKNPPVRIRTSMDRIKPNTIVMFGGVDVADGVYLKDTWLYDGVKHRWEEVTDESRLTPPPRADHRIAYLQEGKVLLYGGFFMEMDEAVVLPGLWLYDIDTRQWSRLEVEGETPPIRMLHSMTNIDEGRVLSVGGIQIERATNDAWVYDYPSNTWSEIDIEGEKPVERLGQDITYIGSGKVVMFGGYFILEGIYLFPDSLWVLNIEQAIWTEYESDTSNQPRGRRDLSLDRLSDGRIVMFGGGYKTVDERWFFLNDMWEILPEG
jgi:N-acetylneuraminic acid mutarotase